MRLVVHLDRRADHQVREGQVAPLRRRRCREGGALVDRPLRRPRQVVEVPPELPPHRPRQAVGVDPLGLLLLHRRLVGEGDLLALRPHRRHRADEGDLPERRPHRPHRAEIEVLRAARPLQVRQLLEEEEAVVMAVR